MTTRVQEDLSFEEFKQIMQAIHEHNNTRAEAVGNGAPDPGPFALPRQVPVMRDEEYSTLPESTLACFRAHEDAHKKQLSRNRDGLQSATDQRAGGSMSQEEYEGQLRSIKDTNEQIRRYNDDDLYLKLVEEGKKHPDQRSKIVNASKSSGDFITGLWRDVGQKILDVLVNILKTIGQWIGDRISDVVNWFGKVFSF